MKKHTLRQSIEDFTGHTRLRQEMRRDLAIFAVCLAGVTALIWAIMK